MTSFFFVIASKAKQSSNKKKGNQYEKNYVIIYALCSVLCALWLLQLRKGTNRGTKP